MSRSRPTTPIRRVSRGSISSHLRASTSNLNAVATPLSFLTQAMSDLSYETSTLHSNLECVEEIDRALLTFDESFSMFLYGLRMNAFCVEWPEAPGEENFQRADERKSRLHMNEMTTEGNRGRHSVSGLGDDTIIAAQAQATADQTYMTADDDADELLTGQSLRKSISQTTQKPPLKSALKKTGAEPSAASKPSKAAPLAAHATPAKARITLAEKKKREAKATEIIDTLPLEYRSGDPKPGQLAKSVILALIAAGDKGMRIAEIAKMPELPQAKVNKCMIALVAAKHVTRRSDNGVVYQLDRSRHG